MRSRETVSLLVVASLTSLVGCGESPPPAEPQVSGPFAYMEILAADSMEGRAHRDRGIGPGGQVHREALP